MFLLKIATLTCLVKIATGYLSIDGWNGHHRSLATDAEKKLQQKLINWNFCTNAFFNASFTPMNSFVPNNTIFLTGYATYNLDDSPDTCKSKTITRTGTINTGEQTVFSALTNLGVFDYTDDWQNGTCGSQFPNETLAFRTSYGNAQNDLFNEAMFTEKLYLDIDGQAKQPFYIFDDSEFYLSACDDNRTTKEYLILDDQPLGDQCDVEPFQVIGGLDSYPNMGWYGIDTRVWSNGESHTYEFGSLSKCVTIKYILTATGEEEKCGLFELGIFCPLKWLECFFGLFT